MLNKVFKVIEAILGIVVVVYIVLSVIFTTLCLDDIIKLFNS
jgi:hypothetical protein